MATEQLFTLMEIGILGIGRTEREMVKEHQRSKMDENMWEDGKMDYHMV